MLSLTVLILLSPLLILISVILLLIEEHEVFYFQERIGRYGKPFVVCKFATMYKNSSNIGTRTITIRNDPRMFPFGRFLHKTKLNELPQLINILFGDMSFVGPRPVVKEGYDAYSESVQRTIYQLCPGLTGIGSIVFRHEDYYLSLADNPNLYYNEKVQPVKGELEKWYYHNHSAYVDFMITFLTCWVILFPKSDLPYKVFEDLPRFEP